MIIGPHNLLSIFYIAQCRTLQIIESNKYRP